MSRIPVSFGLSVRCLAQLLTLLAFLALQACSEQQASAPGSQSQALAQDVHALTGYVFGGGARIAEAQIEAFSNGTSTVVASGATDSDGAYALSLEPGTYDLRVTPPPGSGLAVQGIQDVVMGTSDTRHDIVLLAQGGGAVGGVVRGYGGAAVSGMWVGAIDVATGFTVRATTTDQDGRYELHVGAGSYRLLVQRSEDNPAVPGYFYLYTATQHLSVDAGSSFDIQLPVAKISGKVANANGSAVADTQIAMSGYGSGADGSSWYSNGNASSDPDGAYSMLALTGAVSFVVTPPSPFATFVENAVSVDGDVTHDFSVSTGTRIGGNVLGYGGTALSGMWVGAIDQASGRTLSATTTDQNGHYQLNVREGSYRLLVQRSESNPAVPEYFYLYTATHDVAGTAVDIDVQLPVAKISGKVADANGAAVADAQIAMSGYGSGADGSSWYSNGNASSDSDGAYSMLALTGAVGFVVTPPSPFATFVENAVSVDGDVTHDFSVSSGTRVGGTVLGYGGTALSGMWVGAIDQASGRTLSATTTDQNGHYQLNVREGSYRLLVQRSESNPAVPGYFYLYTAPHDVAGTAVEIDVQLPVAKISGGVTDANGAPVPAVQLSTSGYGSGADGSSWYSNGSASSDESGSYAILTLTGSANFYITPPDASGFTVALLSGLQVDRDFSQSVVLQRPDLSPPVIVSGPIVVHLSDTSVSINFDTNEPASSDVAYGSVGLSNDASSNALVTHHEITLLELQVSSIYSYQVSVRDASGNGPTRSAVLNFRTQDPPGDITRPVITAGPEIMGIGIDAATVTWSTDEPASSQVHFGTSSAALVNTQSSPGFTTNHTVTLSGLSPLTLYYFSVESSDPDGNGPSTSATSAFETLAVPDTQPPQIVIGPIVVAATDHSLTVTWTTDEPSTSGVSFNDGTTYFVLSDTSTLVTEHSMVLADLEPAHTYQITVSSTDRAGNGPTLDGPIQGSTLSAADVTPPNISDTLVSGITQTSAQVSWNTDELATGQIHFGTSPGASVSVQGDTSLATSHSQLLNGLLPGTTYYYTLLSSDASGNKAVTTEASFRTLSMQGPSDGDSDGVADAKDRCSGTPAGALVDSSGCSIEQLCPCAGPSQGKRWKNHGDYVSCVSRAADKFWRKRLLTPAQRRLVVRAAASSACGKQACRIH